MALKPRRLVYGIGINDADYEVRIQKIVGKGEAPSRYVRETLFSCPFHNRWKGILERCYSSKFHEKQPTYVGCSIVSDWIYMMSFRAWMEKQDWEGKVLDKDILFPGNKIYGPETCVFIDQKVNSFVTERQNHRGEWPIGVSYSHQHKAFMARCSMVNGSRKTIGLYKTPEEAFNSWLTFKLEQAKILAGEQTDPRVAKALIDRYENYDNY